MRKTQQKSRQNSSSPTQLKLKLLGHCTMKLLDNQNSIKSEDYPNEMIVAAFMRAKKHYPFHPNKIYATSNCVAVIDSRGKLWAFIDFADEPICISDMLKLKVNDLAFKCNQMILSTSQGQLLLSWGGRKYLPENQLTKITIQNQKYKYAHFFQLYQIQGNCTSKDRFYFTQSQKINSENILYHVTHNNTAIVIYPSLSRINISKTIVGVSLGKYHNFLWDEQGKLYSWGCKSIALGYASLPEEELIDQPREVQLMSGYVTKAYAGINYSLVITLDGKLYEWGIKKKNSKQNEIIFEPRQIKIKKAAKFVDVKGNYDQFGVLSLVGQLYMWGSNINRYMSSNIQVQQQHFSPQLTLINTNKDFIIDFQMVETFIISITSNQNLQTISNNRMTYWSNRLTEIDQNLKGKLRMSSTQSNRVITKQSAYSVTSRRFNHPIELAFEKRKAKQSYLISARQAGKTLNYLMQPTKHCAYASTDLEYFSKQKQNIPRIRKQIKSRRLITTIDDFNKDFEKEKQYVKMLVHKVQKNKNPTGIIRFNRNQESVIRPIKNEDNYEMRLQCVLKRKEANQHMFFEEKVKKVEHRSFQFRIAKRILNQEIKQKAKQCNFVKQSLQKFMIKQFIVKLLSKPIVEARQLKIAAFSRFLKLERIQKKIRGLFIRTRIKSKMKKLHTNQLFRFIILSMTFKRYVKQFRQRKVKMLRKTIVREIFKGVVRQKIKIGLTACNFSIRKLQKFKQWLSLVKSERRRCLKYIWKVHLLSVMKINSDNQSSAIFYLPRNHEEISFETVYQEKVANNPLLRLSKFLNHHSIFKIKTTIFQQLFALSRRQCKKQKSSKMMKHIKNARKFQFRIKFTEDQEDKQDKQDRLNLIQTDIFPYSLHYNIVIHPKNYDITIPEIMKVNQKWIKQQRRILDKHIEIIIKSHEIQYLTHRRKYDIDLANYIKKNYDLFSQKRWKFIIEYNQIEKKYDRPKKQKQIRRLMKLIGYEKILDEDCIPQKQLILEEVSKRNDKPIRPNSFITFGANQFKRMFKIYYETVSSKAKQMRRNFL